MVKLKKNMKGGAKVKKKETEEEAALRREMERLQEEEERLRREEEARIRFKQKQLNEERYSRVNGLKIHNQWLKIMRLAKVESLRKDIEILSQSHEREVDRKDAIIQMLDKDLEDAEEQYQLALRSHLMLMDTLIDIQYSRMKLIENDFVSSITALEEEFGAEREDIVANHAKHRADMLSLLAAMDEEFRAAEAAAQAEFEAARDEITSANQEEYHVAKLTLEQAINELEATFDAAHQAYLASTDTRAQSFQQLTKQDAAAARTIERRARKLARLTDALTHWRAKLLSNTRSWEERNRLLRAEKDSVIKHYGELRDRMMRLRNAEAAKLKNMVLASGACVKTLDERLALAERILKLADLNSKMETEMEAALPLYQEEGSLEDLPEEEKAALKAAEAQGPAEGAAEAPSPFSSWAADENGNPVSEWDALNRFFRRHNKVQLDMAAVERERLRLLADNADLRTALKRFLDGLAVNDDVIRDQENTLLAVGARTMHTAEERTIKRPPNAPPVLVLVGQHLR